MGYDSEIFGSFLDKGKVVFHQGDPGDTMYIIQAGAVEVTQLQGDQETVLALLERGDFFGEMALIDERPRSATVTAIQPTRLLPLTRTTLLERVRQDPGVASHLLRAMSHRIDQATHSLRNMVEGDEALRLALAYRQKEFSSAEEILPSEDHEPSSASETSSLLEAYIIQVDDLSLARDESIWFGANEIIFSEGDPGDTMYIIAEGSVEIFQESEGGKVVLARLGPRDLFGEIALLTDLPRTATALATQSTRLLPIRQSEFFNRVKSDPELALYILQVLIMRLRRIHLAMADPEKSMVAVQSVLPPLVKQKGRVKVAIVSLSTCGGCAAMLLENQDELTSLLERVSVEYCPMLMDHGEVGKVDVVVVDGAVRLREDEEKLREIRHKSRYLVAWGTCASLGGIPTLANQYELEEVIEATYGHTQDALGYYLSGKNDNLQSAYKAEGMALLRRVGKLGDFVLVDYNLPGCPPQLSLLNHLIKELRGESQSGEPRQIVCVECNRKPRKISVEALWAFPRMDWDPADCFSSGAAPCLGFLTRGGCGAVCPRSGLSCWGCRGPSEVAMKKVGKGNTFEQVLIGALIRRCRLTENEILFAMRILRSRGNSLLNFYHDKLLDRSRFR